MILAEHDRQVLDALEWAESGIAGQLTFDFEKAGGVQKEAPPFLVASYGVEIKTTTKLDPYPNPPGGWLLETWSFLDDAY